MKDKLRREYAAMRDAFAQPERAIADRRITENFLAAFSGYESYFVYNSFRSEAGTAELVQALLMAGKRVYLPRVEGEDMFPVPYGELKKGAFGIYEPTGQPYSGQIDITVAPLLAVDGQGYRLGYGGGYYDRFFAKHGTLAVGLGYSFQQTDKQFHENFDQKLSAFVCERGITFYDE